MKYNRISALLAKEESPRSREIFSAVMLLAGPAILEQCMLSAVQYVDTAMVGQLGAIATAAIGVVSSTIILFNGVFNAAAVGFSVQVAQYLGAGREDAAKRVTAQGVKFIFFFGICVSSVGVVLSFYLPWWLGAAEDVAQEASAYFRIIALGMPFTLGVNIISAMIRCSGETRLPMVVNTMINVINVILNYLLIYPVRQVTLFGRPLPVWGAGLGVSGAAIASVSATAVIFLLFLIALFWRKGPIKLSLHDDYTLRRDCLYTAFRLGMPVAMERAATSFAQISIVGIIAGIGTVATAANHLAITAESLSYSPAHGVAIAATTLVGQAIGAQKKELAMKFAKTSTVIGIGIMTLGGVGLFAFAEQLIGFFTPDIEVVAIGVQLLRIVAFAEPMFGAAIVTSGVLRGAGDSRGPFLICLSTMWGVRIVLTLLLSELLGIIGVWLAMAIELVVRGSIFLLRLNSGRWVDKSLFVRSSEEE